MLKLIPCEVSSDASVQNLASDDTDSKEKERERKRQKALAERQSQVQAQKHQLAQNIDRSRAGLERGGGEENFRYVLRPPSPSSGKIINDLSYSTLGHCSQTRSGTLWYVLSVTRTDY
jgi:hypothetical protein